MTSTPQITRLAAFIPFDGLSPSHLDALADQIQVHRLPAGRMVFKRGDVDRVAWFLIEGTLDLVDAGFSVRPFAADDDENYLAVDNYPRHTVNAITREACVLYSLDRDKLDLLMAWAGASDLLPESKPGDDDRDWMDALLGSGLFARVAPARLHELFMRFTPLAVELGQEVVREGDAGDTFYVIKRGHAMVTRGRETLAGLGPGRFFGEDALISDQPRNATVTMTSDGDLMTLDKARFQAIVQASVVRRISEQELQRQVLDGESPCQLIDVRLAMEARHDRIPGARHIPLAELRQQALKLAPEFTYILCAEGRRSELGAYLLSEAGLNAYVLERESGPAAVPEAVSPPAAP
ncbi:cyclic nucleotide-binding domain-containing protein [Alloalcanivorax mobilis]|uniref:cyclic nucleotide-binding domain-containing protein n=1 Tax=Alloalcanivorax mobilis TaxID=2019569 RepID=UPI000C791225|nr:cyclic nucleotide-binding domain-containing protein [Alloalcanivorax mobilis]